MVCFIHRPEYYHLYSDDKTGKDLRGLAQIIVAKHRNGATDSIWLRFRGKYTKFQNEEEAIDPDEISIGAPSNGESVSIQSSMNSDMGAVSFSQQMTPDGAVYNSMGEDISDPLR